MKKKFDLQLFAEEASSTAEANLTTSGDLAPAISIDFTSRLASNLRALAQIVSVNEPLAMNAGQVIKQYKTSIKTKPTTKAKEGEIIPLTEVQRTLVNTITMTLEKYRKATTMEAIDSIGQDKAVNKTDEAVIRMVQKDIKASFFASLASGTGTATATKPGLQGALAMAWGKIQNAFDDTDATPIFFVSSDDVADYLASASVTTQTSFGLSYIEDFMGLGTAFVSPSLTAGTVIATAKENLNMAYVPASTSDIARLFRLRADELGLVGMTHSAQTNTATIETLVVSGVKFFAEDLSKVIKVAFYNAA